MFLSRPQQEGTSSGDASYLQYIYIKYGRSDSQQEGKGEEREEEEEEEEEVEEEIEFGGRKEDEREESGSSDSESDASIEEDSMSAAAGKVRRQKRSKSARSPRAKAAVTEDSASIRLLWERELKKNMESAHAASAWSSPASRSPKPAASAAVVDLDDGDQLEEIDISNSKYSEMNTLELKIDNFCEGGEDDWAIDDVYVPSLYERSSPKPAETAAAIAEGSEEERVETEEAEIDIKNEIENELLAELEVASSKPSPQRITDPLLSHIPSKSTSGVRSDSLGFSAALAKQLEGLEIESEGRAQVSTAGSEGEYLEIDIDEDLEGWTEDHEAVELFSQDSHRQSSAISDLAMSLGVSGATSEPDGSGGYSDRIKALIYGRGAGITGPEDCEVYEFNPDDI